MTHQVVVSLGTFWLLVASPATTDAGPPNPSLSTLPAGIGLVGTGAGGAADPAGAFTVILRDATGSPEADRLVTVDFYPTRVGATGSGARSRLHEQDRRDHPARGDSGDAAAYQSVRRVRYMIAARIANRPIDPTSSA